MFCRQGQHLRQSLVLFNLEARKDNKECVCMYVLLRTIKYQNPKVLGVENIDGGKGMMEGRKKGRIEGGRRGGKYGIKEGNGVGIGGGSRKALRTRQGSKEKREGRRP